MQFSEKHTDNSKCYCYSNYKVVEQVILRKDLHGQGREGIGKI